MTRVKAYRILKRKFLKMAFTGEGARRYGGRWNSPGVAVVYTSSSVALAILEWRCHLTQWPAPPAVLIELEFDGSMIGAPPKLPANWRTYPTSKANLAVGDSWALAAKSAVLKVPSATVPDRHQEYNYLLNPAHPDFRLIQIGKPVPLKLDLRLGPLAS